MDGTGCANIMTSLVWMRYVDVYAQVLVIGVRMSQLYTYIHMFVTKQGFVSKQGAVQPIAVRMVQTRFCF